MSGKASEAQCSNEVTTTPRRLRSGTHYGDQNIQTQPVSKKENKKVSRELNQSCDTDNLGKGDKTKASKHDPIVLHDRQAKRQAPHMSAQPTVPSPQQKQKSHTLKAILESIEPNLCLKLKNKSSKRKSLRDLLDQKFSKEKTDCEEKGGEKEQRKPSAKAERRPVVHNGENHHHFRSYSKDTVGADRCDGRPLSSVETKKQMTMHTRTTSQSSCEDTAKEEPPDDHWTTSRSCVERNSVKTSSSVELRIKADNCKDLDDRSQTFRISCSRPEAVANSPTALPRNMKPDIVLKVRPRSSSLSALSSSSFGSCPELPDPRSKLCSSITSVSHKGSSHHRSAWDLESLPDDLHSKTESCSSLGTNLHTHGLDLQGDCPDHQNLSSHFSSGKSFTLDQLDHEDVLEESKLPPVASTVELLSEPHDVHLNHSNTSVHVPDFSRISGSHQDPLYLGQDQGSPDPQTSPTTSFSTSRSQGKAEGTENRGRDRKIMDTKDSQRRECDPHYPRAGKTSATTMFLEGESSPTMADLREGGKEGVKYEEEGWAVDCGGNQCGKSFTRAEKTLGVQVTNEKMGTARRRRKGRPSRRDNSRHRWHTAHLCLSPRQEGEEEEEEVEEAEEEEEGEQWRETERGRERKEGGGGGGGGGGGSGAREEGTLGTVGLGKSAARSRFPALERGCDVSVSTTTTTRKGVVKRQGESGGGGRRSRKGLDLETLWANPELDTHGFLLWASENRSEMEKRIPDASGVEVEAQLASQWRQLPFSGKLHFLCRARDASGDQNKHTARRKKAPVEKETSPSDGRSVYEEFLRLPQERQKDLLRKWLRFFQKMLPRLEYQDFIGDFKKACKSLSLRPVPARRKNARLRNLDPSHYQMLFEKIRETRPRVISVYNKRKAREEQLLSQTFCTMLRRLILGQPWPFVRGCRSKMLGELLKDIQQLEVEEVLAQIDLPLSLTPADLADPFLEGKELQDPLGSLYPGDAVDSASPDPIPSQTGTNFSTNTKDGHLRKVPTASSANSVMTASTVTSSGDSGELPDNPMVLKVLDSLRHVVDLPVLDQRCLDSIFLAPPSRGSRSQTCRDTQFQNSATYRRTLLYKHIQPLLDARGMPLPSSALYHTHSAQFFYSDER